MESYPCHHTDKSKSLACTRHDKIIDHKLEKINSAQPQINAKLQIILQLKKAWISIESVALYSEALAEALREGCHE